MKRLKDERESATKPSLSRWGNFSANVNPILQGHDIIRYSIGRNNKTGMLTISLYKGGREPRDVERYIEAKIDTRDKQKKGSVVFRLNMFKMMIPMGRVFDDGGDWEDHVCRFML